MNRRWPLLLSLLAGLCAGLLAVLPAAARAADEPDPFLTLEMLSPREVVVPGAAGTSTVTLLDSLGAAIPLTGEGRRDRGADLVIFPPRLSSGEYLVRHDRGEFRFQVGEPPFATLRSPGDAGGFPWLPVLLLLAAGPALFLLIRPGRLALAVPLLGVAVAGGAFLFVGGSDSVPVGRGDPCPVQQADLLDCATTHVLAVLRADGVQAASTELLRISTAPASPWGQICHEVAHTLGDLAFRAERDPVAVIESGFLDCSLGYVHGALEAMGTYLPDDELPAALVAACVRLDELFLPAGTESILGCQHGAGHAAMWRHNEDLTPARAVCDRFALPRQREECKVGALMEWVYADQRAAVAGSPVDAPAPRVGSPLELCAPPHGEMSGGCVEGALTGVGKNDIGDAARWCAQNPAVLSACTTSLARRAVQIDLSEEGPFLTSPMSFCGLFGDASARSECARQLGYMYLFLSRSRGDSERLCASFPEELARSCRAGNRQVVEYAASLGDDSFNFRD